jgi:hypothetical protein
MNDKVYGKSEDPWPYEYVVNALLFFSMEPEARDKYIVPDFPETLFHGRDADFLSCNAKETILFIYAEILGAGRDFEVWIEDEKLEGIGLEEELTNLYNELYGVEVTKIFNNWGATQKLAKSILEKLGWDPNIENPLISCEQILNEYSYDEYDAVKNNA